ncbi:hypothetical protein SAMN05421641_12438 [Paracoccus thiocyanatus]|uniref:Phosphate ABC transporter, permease protein PstA n=1 Tax=Paracoccus thiocyanatus TaxID=34006 RepID=A0A1N6Y3R4_9RHOB|nr:hypothetical protein [Paracoccus thiocyanatus]SIR09262.1 hypothetical protein SAMN05421641_12438 [Paracoccus thiocyanatus]
MRGDRDRPGLAPLWSIIFALMLIIASLLIGALVWIALMRIDWTEVLRFIAPTAFETRSIEEILEGGWR